MCGPVGRAEKRQKSRLRTGMSCGLCAGTLAMGGSVQQAVRGIHSRVSLSKPESVNEAIQWDRMGNRGSVPPF